MLYQRPHWPVDLTINVLPACMPMLIVMQTTKRRTVARGI